MCDYSDMTCEFSVYCSIYLCFRVIWFHIWEKPRERSCIDESGIVCSNFALPIFNKEKPIRFTIEIKTTIHFLHFRSKNSFHSRSSWHIILPFIPVDDAKIEILFRVSYFHSCNTQMDTKMAENFPGKWLERPVHFRRTNKNSPKNHNRKLISTRRRWSGMKTLKCISTSASDRRIELKQFVECNESKMDFKLGCHRRVRCSRIE